jgi:hypothetical protein
MTIKEKLPPLNNSFLSRRDIGSGNLCIAEGRSVLSKTWDFDVYLPSKGMNLQRPLVWTIDQKRSLIESVLVHRSIPPISVIHADDDVYQVIDGKQRLNAFIEYMQGKFNFCGYYYEDLPKDYYMRIKTHCICAYRLIEYSDAIVTDDEKIEWFRLINFAGTPQDLEHMERLSNAKT